MGTVPLHDANDPDLSARVAADIDAVGVSAAVGAIPPEQVTRLSNLIDVAVEKDREWLRDDELDEELGRVVFLPRYGREVLDLLDDEVVMGPCDHVLGDRCILYTMTSLCQAPGAPGRPVHVDIKYATPGFTVGVGVMVLLDDWTVEAGQTRFHPDVTVDPPDPDEFEARALRLEAPAGTVCWFHGRIWHDVGPNATDSWRRSILMAMVRPYVRQRFDMPRIVAEYLDVDSLAPQVAQKLGFELVPPASYEEYFLPGNVRKAELLRRAVLRTPSALSAGPADSP